MPKDRTVQTRDLGAEEDVRPERGRPKEGGLKYPWSKTSPWIDVLDQQVNFARKGCTMERPEGCRDDITA